MTRYLVLLWVFLLSVVTAQLPSQDILSLLQFKKGIKSDPSGYIFNTWNEESIDFNGCPSSWYGIICSGNNVAGVVLNNLNISASTDLGVFANLSMLITLSLANNSISGNLSPKIGSLRKLQYLDISNNLFSGSIPPEFGQLRSLKNLSFSHNDFSGSIPDLVGGLFSIQSLDMSHNSLSGALPSTVAKLTQLVSLNLSCNKLVQNIPVGLSRLQNLRIIDLHQNQLNGVIDDGFFLLLTATYVDLSSNLLSCSTMQKGKFLSALSGSIEYLNLSNNLISGSLIGAGDMPLLEGLKVLDLSGNQLSGELPAFHFAYGLEILRLGSNGFSGFVPSGLLKGDSLVLSELDLSNNNLSGSISMITSTTLQILNLSSNAISGGLSLLTGVCTILDLSSNQFTGNMSMMLKWGNNLEYISLSNNQLTGPFPYSTSQFLRLNSLNISHNMLVGPLPTTMFAYPKISVLDVSYNQFDGPLSSNLLSSPTLTELHLSNNVFVGNLPFTTSSINNRHLQVLDLSQNRLSGDLPSEISRLTSLEDFDISGNNFSGNLPGTIAKLVSLISLDLSSNQFTGQMPDFPPTLQALNVSYNYLVGVVPVTLRNFPDSSFHPGNQNLLLPYSPSASNSTGAARGSHRQLNAITKAVVIIACVVVFTFFILLVIFIHYKRISRTTTKTENAKASYAVGGLGSTALVVSADELIASRSKRSSSPGGVVSPDEKAPGVGRGGVVGVYSPSKNSQYSWSPGSGGSSTPDHLGKLKIQSPDRLAGELHFLDDSLTFTPEELSRAPAEVLGRSSHGTSYRATLDNGVFLTVKWLREGVAKPRKEFAKEAKKFSNIRHPNVVGLKGYYWGPSQHEKLILSEYVVPGNLASFLYDRPTRKGPLLTWNQRLKIAVDVARGLNYLHFDRALPHGNLKSANILLEAPELNARIADYCLHRLMTESGTIEQIQDAGVLGYRAPELAVAKKPVLSFKSDVYSFGVVLLELLTGKCAGDVLSGENGGVDLTDWVRLRASKEGASECFDAAIMVENGNPAALKGMLEMLGIALRCIRPVSERPGIKSVYEDLSSI